MVFDVFRRESTDVFWIVGAGHHIRHATTALPGAVYAGMWTSALCETWLLIPTATPAGREPITAKYTDRCPECQLIATTEVHFQHVWDF